MGLAELAPPITKRMIRTLATAFLVLVWILVMALVSAGYLLKMLVDLILTELVTFYANLGKKIGMP